MADELSQSERDELDRLRAELASYRQRELADLRSALDAARQQAEHYRAEAQRNADTGRQIVAQYEQEITALKAQLEAVRSIGNGRRQYSR